MRCGTTCRMAPTFVSTSSLSEKEPVATRPVFIHDPVDPGGNELLVDFVWHPGFSVAQKQRSIEALHAAAIEALGGGPLLEVSTKSPVRLGQRLSAFNLRLHSDEHGWLSVEAAYQGSKVFVESGQYPELYGIRGGADIKRIIGQRGGEAIVGFRFEGRDWPLEPTTAFYDWLYLRALIDLGTDDPSALAELATFVGFTDIEFNPKRSLSCQARSCALFVSLTGQGTVSEYVRDPDAFIELLQGEDAESASDGRLFDPD